MGEKTLNEFFYKPAYKAKGVEEMNKFHDALDIADAEIKANKDVRHTQGTDYSNMVICADYDHPDDAITAISTDNKTLLVTEAETCDVNFTVPANVSVKFERGGKWTINTGITVTFNGQIDAGLWQIFAYIGTGTLNFGMGIVEKVYPQWWGAKGDGSTDDTTSIQIAIDSVETRGVINTPDWAFMDVPAIYFPEGTYIVTGLTISSPLSFIGVSSTSSIIHSHTDAPIITVQGHPSALTSVEDIKTIFRDLAIIGDMGSGYDIPVTKSSQHGIFVDSTVADTEQPRIEVHKCNIRHCGGNGIYLTTSVSNRIYNSNITLNAMAGIYITGIYNTDIRIMSCSIRRNRIGIHIEPTAGSYITTGLIANNVIESNRNGTGDLGSATRPATGIWLLRTQNLIITNNYFESHLNDIYLESNVSFCRFSQNYHDSGGMGLNYPRTRRMATYYFDGITNNANIIEKNRIYKPTRPDGVTEANWGTATWGDTYEHLLLNSSYHQIIENISRDPSTGNIEEITIEGGSHLFIEQRYIDGSGFTRNKITSERHEFVGTMMNKLSDFAATTSAELAGVISDEVGTGKLVFATEGEWTMGISFGGGTTGITYAANTGYYTKIGRQVTITGYLSLSAKGTSTGAALLTGLPFTCKDNSAAYAPIAARLGNISFANAFQGYVQKNATYISLREVTEGGTETVLDDANFADNSLIVISATYFTD